MKHYGQDFGYNHADAILGVGWKDGEVYICSEIYVFEKDTEEIISLAKQNKVDQRIEMFCDSAEPDRIKTWSKAAKNGTTNRWPGTVRDRLRLSDKRCIIEKQTWNSSKPIPNAWALTHLLTSTPSSA